MVCKISLQYRERRTLLAQHGGGALELAVLDYSGSVPIHHCDAEVLTLDSTSSAQELWSLELTDKVLRISNDSAVSSALAQLLRCRYLPSRYHGEYIKDAI